MTSETEHEGDVPNPFLNPIRVWQNYLIYWIEANRNFYENAVRTNEQWLKALCDPWLKPGNPSQRETVKVERNIGHYDFDPSLIKNNSAGAK